jgi:transposase, IS5 family
VAPSAVLIENAYFQYFSCETYFQTALPLDRTSMWVWRGRIGPEKLEALIAETLAAARRAGAVEPSQMRRLTIDTTAQTRRSPIRQPSALAGDRMAEPDG